MFETSGIPTVKHFGAKPFAASLPNSPSAKGLLSTIYSRTFSKGLSVTSNGTSFSFRVSGRPWLEKTPQTFTRALHVNLEIPGGLKLADSSSPTAMEEFLNSLGEAILYRVKTVVGERAGDSNPVILMSFLDAKPIIDRKDGGTWIDRLTVRIEICNQDQIDAEQARITSSNDDLISNVPSQPTKETTPGRWGEYDYNLPLSPQRGTRLLVGRKGPGVLALINTIPDNEPDNRVTPFDRNALKRADAYADADILRIEKASNEVIRALNSGFIQQSSFSNFTLPISGKNAILHVQIPEKNGFPIIKIVVMVESETVYSLTTMSAPPND